MEDEKTEESTWHVTELEIVGYADCLVPEVLPDMADPIYRVRRHPEVMIFPPYDYLGDRVRTNRVLGEDELERLVQKDQATALKDPIPARPGHLLWIDLGMNPRYMLRERALAELKKLSELKLEEAQDALRSGRMREAIDLAQVAFCADGTSREAVELMGRAWGGELGDEGREATLKSILEDMDREEG